MEVKKTTRRESEIDEDDDGLPNTYDYNDSFINDASQSLGQSQATGDDDEDDNDDDVGALKKEAKAFVRNRKLMKPV